MKPDYYNEIDEYAAAWLRNLIVAGHLPAGEVDTRSIEDVRPDDLRGYRQCHFFAGVGVWAFALRRAGWPDDREVWTGSCPCQPFSAAGQGAGFADERHLWPAFHHLIAECRPAVVLGEQVASSHINPWIDLVHADLEALGYAFGGVPFPSAGIGAPHIRDRLYWVADAADFGQHGWGSSVTGDGRDAARVESERLRLVGRMADANGGHAGAERQQRGGEQRQQPQDSGPGVVAPGGLADDQSCGRREERADAGRLAIGNRPQGIAAGFVDGSSDLRSGPTNGFWRDADWLGCRDGRWRPVEPGTFPLAHGATARVGRLRAYGNAINASAAEVFIRCVMECAP